jgi:signal peptidase I
MSTFLAAVPVLAVALAAIVLRRRYLSVTVTGASMEPALYHGDRVLVRRVSVGAVHPGQVVVLTGPADRPTDWMVKRAAAVPGDPVPRTAGACAGPVVPEDHLVVLGDNAALSLDSRRLGYLPADRLVGVVVRQLPALAPARTAAATARTAMAAGNDVPGAPARGRPPRRKETHR